MKNFSMLIILLFLHVHCVVGDPGSRNPTAKWKFKTQGSIRGSALIHDDKIYFGSADGKLYSLDKDRGKLLWSFHANGAIVSTPTLAGSNLVFTSRDNFVYAIEIETGKLSWKFRMKEPLAIWEEWQYFTPAPVVANDKLWIGSDDGNLYVLSLEGKLLWNLSTQGKIHAAPLIADGKVYQPSDDGVMYVLEEESGNLLWKFETDGANYNSKDFGWDRTSIYTKPLLQDSLLVIASRDGKTYAVNIHTQRKKWDFTYGSSWAMSTALEDGVVYTGWSDVNLVSAVDLQTGAEKWQFKAGSLVYTTPFIVGNEIIIGSADEKIYKIDKLNGEKIWEYKTNGSIFSSPIADENTLYVGSDDGYLYAINEGQAAIKVVYHPDNINEGLEGSFLADAAITPYLKDRGFAQLDSAKLHQFLKDRIQDKRPSVIVFPYTLIPKNLIGNNPAQGLFRQYLDTGGKVIWFGTPPNLFDPSHNFQKDITIPNRLLGIDFTRLEEGGNYYSTATQTGLNLGMPSWLTTTFAIVNPKDVIPLALDEMGRITAWMKRYHDRAGSGFISCRTWGYYSPIHTKDLELIYSLATYGLE